MRSVYIPRQGLSAALLVFTSLIAVAVPPLSANGISVRKPAHVQSQHRGQQHGHAAVGNVQITHGTRYRHRDHSRRDSGTHARQHKRYNGHNAGAQFRFQTSPAWQYYGFTYFLANPSSRFPQSYQNYGSYQQARPQYYGQQYYQSESAWLALTNGQANLALNQFGGELRVHPEASLPNLGYALAAAAGGDLKQGIYHMREAFRLDPAYLRGYRPDPALYPLLDDLLAEYQYTMKRRGFQKDAAFMVASLFYLQGNFTSAQQALDRAKRDGDRSHSYRNLQEIVGSTRSSMSGAGRNNLYRYLDN